MYIHVILIKTNHNFAYQEKQSSTPNLNVQIAISYQVSKLLASFHLGLSLVWVV